MLAANLSRSSWRSPTRALPSWLAAWVALVVLFMAGQGQAQSPEAARPLFQAFFVEGIAALQQGRNADAVRLLEQALQYNPERQDARNLLAIAAFRAGEYDKAIQAAEQFLQTEASTDVSFLLARSYQAIGEPERAREIYASIKEAGDQEYAERAEEALAALEAQQYFPRPPRFGGFVVVGSEYDSNIASSAEEGSEEPSNVSDGSSVNTLQFDYNEPLGDRYFAGLGFLGFGNFHFSSGRQFDLQLLRGTTRAGLVGSNWRLALEYQHDTVFFDYHNTIESNRIQTNFISFFSQKVVTSLITSVSWDNFPNNAPQDAVKYDLQSRNRMFVPSLIDGAYIKGNYQFTYNDTQERSVFQYYANEIGLGFFTPLPVLSTHLGIDDAYLNVDASFEVRPYDEPNPDDRTDLTWEWSVTLGKELIEDLTLELTYRRLVTRSTESDFNKTQNIVGLYTTFAF